MGGVLSDREIRRRVALQPGGPCSIGVTPFEPAQIKRIDEDVTARRVVGYGLSGFGYDVRLGHSFRFLARGPALPSGRPGSTTVLPEVGYPVLDPLDPEVGNTCYDPPAKDPPRVIDRPFLLLPGECVLGESVERIRMPRDCQALVICKSTWARCFLDLNTTPLEPGWEGTITLEIVNHASLPLRLRPGEGIAQVVFIQGESFPEVSYDQQPLASYMHQSGPTPPRGGPRAA